MDVRRDGGLLLVPLATAYNVEESVLYSIVVEKEINGTDEQTDVRQDSQRAIDNVWRTDASVSCSDGIDRCPAAYINGNDKYHVLEKTCITIAEHCLVVLSLQT